MTRVELRKATVGDAERLAPVMRDNDVLEVYRAAGYAPLEALVRSMMASRPDPQALYFDGEPAAMFGIVQPDLLGPVGIPWLLTGPAVERHPLTFFRLARAYVARWADEFPTLVQFVDEEYAAARRFLQALGFTIYPPVEYGASRAPFLPAVRSRHV